MPNPRHEGSHTPTPVTCWAFAITKVFLREMRIDRYMGAPASQNRVQGRHSYWSCLLELRRCHVSEEQFLSQI
jgi:hypothetical protein